MQRAHDPTQPLDREGRRQLILEWVGKGGVRSQFDLQSRLAERGVSINQATLSRDIHALGLLKGPEGYELPVALAPESDDGSLGLYAAVYAWLNEVAVAQNLVIVRTPAGAAGPLAIAIDKSGWSEVVGTIAGDDTIFVATHGATAARRVARQLTDLKDRKRK